MKTKSLRIGKRSLSLALSLLMMVSTIFVGSFGTADARTVDGTAVSDVIEDVASANDNSIDLDVSENVSKADDNTLVVDVDADSISSQLNGTNQSASTSKKTAAVSNKKSEKVLPESSGDSTISTITYAALANKPIASGKRRVLVEEKAGFTAWEGTTPYIYEFGNDGDTGASWDKRPQMTAVTGSSFTRLSYYDISINATHVILTNGRYGGNENQTTDINLAGMSNTVLITLYGNNQINDGNDKGKRNNLNVSNYTFENKPLTGDVTVYAKTGTIRDKIGYNYDGYGNFDKYSKLAESVDIAYTDGSDLNVTKSWGYDENDSRIKMSTDGERLAYADVARKKDFTVTVKLKDDYIYKYYVKAFCINGDSYNIIDEDTAKKQNGVYTCTYRISDRETGPIEITPIYYYFEGENSKDYITFSVEDFTEDVKSIWGNTVACYAYYGVATDYSGNTILTGDRAPANNDDKPALGGYPGQPMVKINGIYYMQIPKTVNGKSIEGITLNNYIWDDIHAQKINGLGITNDADKNEEQIQLANAQTYDYDDFVALAQRDTDKIVFRFKYRTYNNYHEEGDTKGNSSIGNPLDDDTYKVKNFSNNLDSFVTGANGNGWEVLTDYEGYPVDLFARRFDSGERDGNGNVICQTQDKVNKKSTDTVYVVSNGYEPYYYGDNAANKYIGQYATKWYVYTKSDNGKYKYIGALPPSAFLTGIKSDKEIPVKPNESLSASADTSYSLFLSYLKDNGTFKAGKISSDDATAEWNEYQTIYNECAGKHVVIAYESNIYAEGRYLTTKNPGFRCDGRWTYSKPNEKINAKVKIQIINKNGDIVVQEKGNTKSYFDEFTADGSHIGSKTGANAYFTNEGYYGATEQTDVKKSLTEKFTFVADENSTSTDGKYYIFRGWYVYTGDTTYTDGTTHSNEYTEVNVGDDIFNINGERLKDASVTLVARYEEVDPSEVLRVSHSLLSSITDDPNTPVVHNGEGETEVTVKILDANNNIAWEKTGTDVTVPADILARYKDLDGYKVEVTLTTKTDDNTSVVGVYRREKNSEPDTSYAYNYYKSGLGSKENDSTGENIKASESIKAPSSNTIGTNTVGNVTTSTVVYTYDFSNLYKQEGGKNTTLKTNSLAYFSDPEYNALVITHDLYSNDAVAPKDDNSPKTHNGTINELGVTVSIVGKDGNVVKDENNKELTFDGSGTDKTSKSVKLTSELLEKYKDKGYQIKITLPAKAGENSAVDAVYRKDSSNNDISYVESNKENNTGWTVEGDYGDGITEGTPKTYYYNISELFTNGSLNTDSILFLSDASRVITIEFKYYDRDKTDKQTATINTTETTVTFENVPVSTDNVTNAIANALINDENNTMQKIGNILDEYRFWTTQTEAIGDDGVKSLPNYRADSTGGTAYKDTTDDDGDEVYYDYTQHTDPYGRFCNESGYGKLTVDNDGQETTETFDVTGGAWVTYYDGDEKEIDLKEAENNGICKNPNVTKVVIWAYNTPKRYNVDVLVPKSDVKLENSVDYKAGNAESSVKVYYVTNEEAETKANPSLRNQVGFYNQRLDREDDEAYDNVYHSNDPAAYLTNYGIKAVFLDNSITSAPEAKDSNDNKLVFDGWYVLNSDKDNKATLTKISSEETYGNRITTPLTLVAGYREEKSTDVGVSVTKNGVDYYVDDNGKQKVRLNTELNVYGAEDRDPDIMKVAAIYVRLDSKTEINNDVIEAVRSKLNTPGNFTTTYMSGSDEVQVNGKVFRYNYTVGAVDDSGVTLTNKNRVQFVLGMSASSFNGGANSKILAFGAIEYKDNDNWIYSDNCAVFDGNVITKQTPDGVTPDCVSGKTPNASTAASADVSNVVVVPEFPEND